MTDYIQIASQEAIIKTENKKMKVFMLFGHQALLFTPEGIYTSGSQMLDFDLDSDELLSEFSNSVLFSIVEKFDLGDKQCEVYVNKFNAYLVVVKQDEKVLGYKIERPQEGMYSKEFASGLAILALNRTKDIQARLDNIRFPSIHKNRRVSYGGNVPCPYCGYDIRIDCNYGEYYRKPECYCCGKTVRVKINVEIECWLEDFAPKKGQRREKLIEQYTQELESSKVKE